MGEAKQRKLAIAAGNPWDRDKPKPPETFGAPDVRRRRRGEDVQTLTALLAIASMYACDGAAHE